MSKLIQVHDVPEPVHAELKRRAADQSMSLSAYLRAELTTLADEKPLAELMERFATNAASRGFRPEEPPAVTIRRHREELDQPGPPGETTAEAIRRRRESLG